MLVKYQLEDKSIHKICGREIEVTIKPNTLNNSKAISWCKIKSYGDNTVSNTYFGTKIINIKCTLF